MLTRRDQLQAYQFRLQRFISAVTRRETDPLTPPFRRFLTTGVASLVVAALVMTVSGIYGLLSPGGKESWRAGDKVILERETGAQYIYRRGKLIRVANYTSGVLLLGRNNGTVTVTRKSLLGVPRGPEVGIQGAPDGLPSPDELLGYPWTLCSRTVSDLSGTDQARTVLLVGQRATGGVPAGGSAFLVEDTDEHHLYLVEDGYRHLVTDEPAAITGLALSQEPRVRAGSAWLDALPRGADLAPMHVNHRGAASKFPGARVGQLMVVPGKGEPDQYYVAVANGLVSISQVQFALLFASKDTGEAYPDGIPAKPREITAAQAAAATVGSELPTGPGQLPRTRPHLSGAVARDTMACASFSSVTAAPQLHLGGSVPLSNSDLATARRSPRGTALADKVVIAPGRGALIVSAQSSHDPGVLHLVTEQGIRYPLSSRDVATTLGYSPSDAVRLPAEIVARLPEGVAIDPQHAGKVLLHD
jgi:type VII secretion protein EccB